MHAHELHTCNEWNFVRSKNMIFLTWRCFRVIELFIILVKYEFLIQFLSYASYSFGRIRFNKFVKTADQS